MFRFRPAAIFLVILVWRVAAQPRIEAFVSDDPSIRQRALRELAALTPDQKLPYLPELIRLLHGKDGYRVGLAFAKIGPPAAPVLRSQLTAPDRVLAVRALAMIRPAAPETIEAIRPLLDDSNTLIHADAAIALRALGVDNERVRSILSVPPPEGSRGRPIPGGIPEWMRELGSSDEMLRSDARVLLRNAGDAAIPPLVDALRKGDSRLRSMAASTLASMQPGRPDVEAAAIPLLKDPAPETRGLGRQILFYFQSSETAMEALLEDEVAEQARRKSAGEAARAWRTSTHTREEVLAPIPPVPEREVELNAAEPSEATGPDGTTVLAVLHHDDNPMGPYQVLRIWRRQGDRYSFLKEWVSSDDTLSYLSSTFFRFRGRLYVHVMTLYDGNAFIHENEFFRIERTGLTPIRQAGLGPVKLKAGEHLGKAAMETFEDDNLRFELGIYQGQDPHCCPSTTVTGTYTITGNEMRVATWQRQ